MKKYFILILIAFSACTNSHEKNLSGIEKTLDDCIRFISSRSDYSRSLMEILYLQNPVMIRRYLDHTKAIQNAGKQFAEYSDKLLKQPDIGDNDFKNLVAEYNKTIDTISANVNALCKMKPFNAIRNSFDTGFYKKHFNITVKTMLIDIYINEANGIEAILNLIDTSEVEQNPKS
ncbi:MAG: hypothetical protein HY958_05625 [Bacteroidia bacterium]|nr:hypothetical protein [Bacteroidia bacterium]